MGAKNQQEGIVLEVHGKVAKVKASRHSHCDSCGSCPGSSAMVLEAYNPVSAQPGQRIIMEIRGEHMLKAAFIVFVMPLIVTFLGAWGGDFVANQFGFASVASWLFGGIGAFLLSIWYIKRYDYTTRMDDRKRPVIIQTLE